MKPPRLYVDHAATTPMREEAVAAMLPLLADGGYNPSSQHAEGRAARAVLDRSRVRVAELLGARTREIVFTGGGTEADTLAIVGGVRAALLAGRRDAHVVTTAIEHDAVRKACDHLRDDGVETTVVAVDAHGRVDASAFAAALRPTTVLASVMLANNELGTICDVAALTAIARARGVLVHTDAIQAAGRLPLAVDALGVDLLTLSGHKFYGPKGVGALYVRTGTALAPIVPGGGQEHGLRSGTQNVAGIAGFARAFELAVAELPAESERIGRVRDAFETRIVRELPGVTINAAAARRLPNLSNVAFAGVETDELVFRFDLDGISVSGGSACSAGALVKSHVLEALPVDAGVRRGSVRFSFGKLTSEANVERLVDTTVRNVRALRSIRPDVGIDDGFPTPHRAEVRS